MSFKTQAILASDQLMLQRVTACAASEGIADPGYWTQSRAWQLSAQPGWDAAYSSAISAGVDDPGTDEDVITDSMILTAVQALRAIDEGVTLTGVEQIRATAAEAVEQISTAKSEALDALKPPDPA